MRFECESMILIRGELSQSVSGNGPLLLLNTRISCDSGSRSCSSALITERTKVRRLTVGIMVEQSTGNVASLHLYSNDLNRMHAGLNAVVSSPVEHQVDSEFSRSLPVPQTQDTHIRTGAFYTVHRANCGSYPACHGFDVQFYQTHKHRHRIVQQAADV